MALTNSYLVTTKNLEAFFNALVTAQAPERFTQKFLESLEFKSSNDRLYIGLMKGLGFVDEAGIPQDRYYRFLDQTQSKKVLAEGIKEAYGDLFAVQTKANELTAQDVKNKLRTLTQGKKTDNVLQLMANTFRALCDYADWSSGPKLKIEEQKPKQEVGSLSKEQPKPTNAQLAGEFHYNIQIHLPESRDQAVYDAIFKSLKDHLF
ncbi:MAG: DUF5343 domain-containing protein [Candidatus Yanofskybacteria bacterium]|nr:DUF5343 domain-containing protein [Candidatus Yanofskybacteria bacterium]